MNKKLNISSATSRVIDSMRFDFERACAQSVEYCEPLVESEIELMLLSTFHLASRITALKVHIGKEFPANGDIHLLITPQFQWKEFRIDFRLQTYDFPDPIFVECDGHDFHERAKEQAERDRSSDRAVQAAGIPILRFTGREIWRDPAHVGAEILDFLGSHRDKRA